MPLTASLLQPWNVPAESQENYCDTAGNYREISGILTIPDATSTFVHNFFSGFPACGGKGIIEACSFNAPAVCQADRQLPVRVSDSATHPAGFVP